jgi:hypothetical protein
MLYAPEHPTTAYLESVYEFSREDDLRVQEHRSAVNSAILHPDNDLYIAGPCALTSDWEDIRSENIQWDEFVAVNGIKSFLKRYNPWKPRSDPNAWHGLETESLTGRTPSESAEEAYALINEGARTSANIAMEMAFPYHLLRYGKLTTFAWVGSRNEKDIDESTGIDFIDMLAKYDPTLPVGIKNSMDGNLELAIGRVKKINRIRSHLGISAFAPAVLIYRGGENVRTASEWYNEAERIIGLEDVQGRVILDHAHMGEMACDPDGFEKTEEGQSICWDRAIELRRSGKRFVGSQTESSNLKSPVDPPLPIEVTMSKIRDMERAKINEREVIRI